MQDYSTLILIFVVAKRPPLLRRLAALIGPEVSVQRDRQASAAKKTAAAAKKAATAKKDGCPDWPQSFSS